MNYKERNWLAGFVDGEGCIDIYYKKDKRKNKTYEYFIPRVVIANTNKEAIDYISSHFPNSHSISKQQQFLHWKPCYLIKFTNNNAIKIIKEIYPYLKIKKNQALLCLKLDKNINPNRSKKLHSKTRIYRETLYKECKKLNKRGK